MKKALSNLADKVNHWLTSTNSFWFSFYAAGAAFSLYTCVYAFRKTFSVATFDGLYYFGIRYKVWLVIAQVIGYGLSKFIGIKIISELQAKSRPQGILILVAIAGVSWFCFAITPAPYNVIFLFTNGLPLGLVWGMVFSYLEGRKTTEVLGAGLSISFIFSAGFCKSVGGYIMRDWGTAEKWMPLLASLVFIIPLLLFLWLLDRLPTPSEEDIHARTKRAPMNGRERKRFLTAFWPGIVMFVLAYMLLTSFRDFRDNFAADIWKSLGYGNSPEIFTRTEIPISIIVLTIMGSLMLFRNNIIALLVNHAVVILGFVAIGVVTFLFAHGYCSPTIWMITIGLGLYLGYVPFNSIFFDRLIAAFNYIGTVGFIMYVSDSFGYLSSIGVLLAKEFGFSSLSWLEFLINVGYIISITGAALMTGSLIYFQRKHAAWQQLTTPSDRV